MNIYIICKILNIFCSTTKNKITLEMQLTPEDRVNNSET